MKSKDIDAARNTAYTAAWHEAQSLLNEIKDELDYLPPPFDGVTWAQLAFISRVVKMLHQTMNNPDDDS